MNIKQSNYHLPKTSILENEMQLKYSGSYFKETACYFIDQSTDFAINLYFTIYFINLILLKLD
jgi:hypothetical protein